MQMRTLCGARGKGKETVESFNTFFQSYGDKEILDDFDYIVLKPET